MIASTGIAAGAVFDPGDRYRYRLWRTWDTRRPSVAFLLLNPSVADATRDDPTLRRCLGFARAWGYGGVEIANLFAWRATDPATLRRCVDPVGPDNDAAILAAIAAAPLAVAAWGNGGRLHDRAAAVLRLLAGAPLMCLGLTGAGQPRHPLYTPGVAAPQRWDTGGEASHPTTWHGSEYAQVHRTLSESD